MRTRTATLLTVALLAAALQLALLPRAAGAYTDPFYLDLLRDGMAAYDHGEFPAAAKQLRLACFGMLDDPLPLGACLTRLSLAQAGAGDGDGFRETFHRLVAVEDRFGAYTKAELPPEIRAAFEQRAVALVPASTLEALPGFKDLFNRRAEAQLAALPPRERRQQVEARLAKEPKSLTWNLALAELDLAEGQTAAAVARAEQTVVIAPREPRALCLRGLARATVKRCGEALADLTSCWLCGREPRYAAALLGCRIDQGQWRQADEQVRSLPAGLKQDRQIAGLMQQVARHQGGAGGSPGAGTAVPRGTGAGSATSGATAAGTGPTAAGAGTRGGGTNGGGTASSGTGSRPGGSPPARSGGGSAAAGPAASPATGSAAPAPGASAPSPGGGAAPAGGGSASRPSPALSPAERETMAHAERLLTANNAGDLKEALRLAHNVAEAHPDAREAQYLAGEAAYRNARWAEAATYFRRAGQPGDDRPELLFYMAVSLYEVGDQAGAAAALKRSLPNLQKTPYVQSYVKRILGQ
jgi:Flp pilus assembly protein TadD